MKVLDTMHFKNIYFENAVYGQSLVVDEVKKMASFIDKQLVTDSPFIHVVAVNHIKTIVCMFAVWKLGKIVVIIDPLSKSIEREEFFNLAEPAAIIQPDIQTISFDYSSEVQINKVKKSVLVKSDLTDVNLVLFTHAEHGSMKAVMLTNDNMLHSLKSCHEGDTVNAQRTSCALLPFSHIFGFISGVLAPLTSGADVAIYDISRYQEFRTMTQFIKNTGVTNLYTVPLMYYFFTKVADIGEMMSGVQSLFSGGIKLERSVYDSFLQKTGKEVHEAYGLTEVCGMAACNHYGRAMMPDTLGTPFSCNTMALFENGKPVMEIGKTGEICIKGHSVMRGFLNDEEATKQVVTDGWFHTGDLGHFADNGYIFFDGLKKRMLNAGGLNVYPAEVERIISENLPNVAKIEVFGEHKPLLGHTIMANILLRENTPENQKLVKDWALDNLSPFKVPKRWSFEG